MVALKNASMNVKKALKCVEPEKKFTTKKMVGVAAVVGTLGLARQWYLKNKSSKQNKVRTSNEKTQNQLTTRTTAESNDGGRKRLIQDQLNNNCFRNVKKQIAYANTQKLRIAEKCETVYVQMGYTKDKVLGNGVFGSVFSVCNNNQVVIKEQYALCYTFINEIRCLEILKSTDYVPQIYDAYVCWTGTNKTFEDVENAEVTYGYVMETMGVTLRMYLLTYPTEN